MTDAEVRHYLMQIHTAFSKQYEGETDEAVFNCIEALSLAADRFKGAAEGGWRYHSIFCPPDDMMPYEHLDILGDVEDELDKASKALINADNDDECIDVSMTFDEIEMVKMLLTMYKGLLMNIYKKKVAESIAEMLKNLGKLSTEEGDNE